eukprot:m.66429 g.66429  ORF g.66429 m.66429 type:complete len:66 (+) comp35388_c0_seq1:708-905(+)
MIHDPTGGSGGVQFQVVANSPAGAQPSVITFNSPQPQQASAVVDAPMINAVASRRRCVRDAALRG